MTQEELKKLKDQIKEAESSVTPFPIVTENEIAVAGDANQTQIKPTTFEITFALPRDTGGKVAYDRHTVTYKDVYPKPRNMVTIDRMISILLPYLMKANEDGSIDEYSDEEMKNILIAFDEDVTNIMYDLVAAVIGVDKELKDFMLPSSVFQNLVKIIKFFPEAWNEGDTFFG